MRTPNDDTPRLEQVAPSPSLPREGLGDGKQRHRLDAGGVANDASAENSLRSQPTPTPSLSGRGDDPIRRCIISGGHGTRARLIRLALGPDGSVAPDVRAKAPGRGAWIGVDRATLETALTKGKLRGALCRAFKTQGITVPDDLPERIEIALRRATLDRLGLEAKGGTLLTGSDRIADAARKGAVALLLHAADASIDGNRKLDQALRIGLDREGEALRGLVIPADRTTLSMALGRENVVHLALTAPAAAARVSEMLDRWCGYIGRDGGSEPCELGSRGPTALPGDFEPGG